MATTLRCQLGGLWPPPAPHRAAAAHVFAPFSSVSCPSRPLTRRVFRMASVSPTKQKTVSMLVGFEAIRGSLFVPPGVDREEVTEDMVLPRSNIVVGPYAGHSQIKQVEFVKSSPRARDCPKDDLPEFAILGRSNVGKSSLINTLVKRKEFALTSKKPGKTQFINHFLINKSWYIVDLPGYGFANAPQSARMDWFSFTKGYFLNRDTLVGVLLLMDASLPPQKIAITLVFTKCDKMKGGKGSRPDENIRSFQEEMRKYYQDPLPWIMTSSATGLSRDELLLHMSQLRNYWDN